MGKFTDMIYRAKVVATERRHKDLTVWKSQPMSVRTIYGVPVRNLPMPFGLPSTYYQEGIYVTVNTSDCLAFTTDLEGYISPTAGETDNPHEFALAYHKELGASVVPMSTPYAHSYLEELPPHGASPLLGAFGIPEGRARVLMGDDGLSLIANHLFQSELDRRVKQVAWMIPAREGFSVRMKPTPEPTDDQETLLSRAGASPNFDYHPKAQNVGHPGEVGSYRWGMAGNTTPVEETNVKVVDHNFPVKPLGRKYKYNYYLHVGSDTEDNLSVGLLEALLANARPEARDDDSLKIGEGWAFAQEETETSEDDETDG